MIDAQIALYRHNFERLGITEIKPYEKWNRHGYHVGPDTTVPVDIYYGHSKSVEYYYSTDAWRACERIANILRFPNDRPEYRYLKAHPELYENEIRPRLLHLAESRGAGWIAYMACRALVAGGDRSEALKQRLTDMVLYSEIFIGNPAALMQECGWEVPEPLPTAEAFPAYDAPNTATGAQGHPLPSGALRRVDIGQALGLLDADTTAQPRPVSRPSPTITLLGHDPGGNALFIMYRTGQRDDGHILMQIDIDTGEVSRIELAGPDKIDAAAICNQATTLATYGVYRTEPPDTPMGSPRHFRRLMLWDLRTREPIAELSPSYRTVMLKFSPDGSRLIAKESVHARNSASVYDLTQRQLLYRFGVEGLSDAMFLPDGAVLCVEGGRMRIRRERSGMQAEEVNPLLGIQAAASSASGDSIATFTSSSATSNLQHMMMWDRDALLNPQPYWESDSRRLIGMHPLRFAITRFASVTFTPGDEFLLTLLRRERSRENINDIIAWTKEGRPLGRIAGHTAPVTGILFAGDKLVSASSDATLLIWDWHAIARWLRERAAQP